MEYGKEPRRNDVLFNLIYRVQELEKESNKAQSKIRKMEKALNYKKIAKYTDKYLGKKAKNAIQYTDTTWADLLDYLGVYHIPEAMED